MNVQEKAIARKLFQNRILKSDGQAFEDIFTEVMNYSERDFRSIKPWGNIGDRKNDGYIKTKGIFYQVYAPEEIRKSYLDAVKKLKNDFQGLLRQWSPINEFYFIVNDKYKGVNADCEIAIQDIKKTYNLRRAGILTTKDIENILFKLEDDQILNITGLIPDPASIKDLDYSVLNEVIYYIMQIPIKKNGNYKIIVPDWDNKIKFNNLSEMIADILMNGCIQKYSLEEYLSNNSDFIADSLRDKLNEIYYEEKETKSGDDLFWAMVGRLSPKSQYIYQATVITIMAKYFETCDIFEEPLEEGEK
ncbi:MAG: hypothetical protein E7255_08345 [Lachnospiraceae bacterium]|nr:hypothetical protein [Lachnospiraceae bacterium]